MWHFRHITEIFNIIGMKFCPNFKCIPVELATGWLVAFLSHAGRIAAHSATLGAAQGRVREIGRRGRSKRW